MRSVTLGGSAVNDIDDSYDHNISLRTVVVLLCMIAGKELKDRLFRSRARPTDADTSARGAKKLRPLYR